MNKYGPKTTLLVLIIVQNLQGGVPRMVEGTEHPLWAMEIDPEREKDIFRTYTEGEYDVV